MDKKNIQDKFIQKLGEELEMEEFITSTNRNSYLLSFDNAITIAVSKLSAVYLFKADICPCPSISLESFFLRVMEANLFGLKTYGSSIGLKEPENILTLTLEVDYNSSYKDFKNKLEEFANVIEFWRNKALTN